MAYKVAHKYLIFFAALGILAVGLYFAFQPHNPTSNLDPSNVPEGPAVGLRAPDFGGTTVDGEVVRISDYQGKIVLVNLFASWCGPCQVETPYLVEAYQNNRNDVMVIGLNLQESPAAITAYRDDYFVPYPLVQDPEGRFVEIYHPRGLPTSWFIDSEGVVRYVHSGPMTPRMIQKIIDDIRTGAEPDPFTSG